MAQLIWTMVTLAGDRGSERVCLGRNPCTNRLIIVTVSYDAVHDFSDGSVHVS